MSYSRAHRTASNWKDLLREALVFRGLPTFRKAVSDGETSDRNGPDRKGHREARVRAMLQELSRLPHGKQCFQREEAGRNAHSHLFISGGDFEGAAGRRAHNTAGQR